MSSSVLAGIAALKKQQGIPETPQSPLATPAVLQALAAQRSQLPTTAALQAAQPSLGPAPTTHPFVVVRNNPSVAPGASLPNVRTTGGLSPQQTLASFTPTTTAKTDPTASASQTSTVRPAGEQTPPAAIPNPLAGRFSLHVDPDTGQMTASGSKGPQTSAGAREWDVSSERSRDTEPVYDLKTLMDFSRYKTGTPEERLAAWRKDIDAYVKQRTEELHARIFTASDDLIRLKPIYEQRAAMNAEDHKNYDEFIKATLKARLFDPQYADRATPAAVMAEFPFDSWARVPDASLAKLKEDIDTTQSFVDNGIKTYQDEVAKINVDNSLYKIVDSYTAALGTYRQWEEKYKGAQSGNSIAEQNYAKDVENYQRIAGDWQKYADADAQWKAQKAQLDADIAAGKFRVQNAWKAILSGKLTPAQVDELMKQLEAGEVNPNLGVPQLPPAPVPPQEPMPKEPPAPPALADLPPLQIDPSAANALGIDATHAGGTPTAIVRPDAITPTAGAVAPVAAAAATPWSAPVSSQTPPTSSTGTAPTSSTGASGSTPPATGSTQTTPTGSTPTPPAPTPQTTTPPWAPDHVPTLAEAQAFVYPKDKPKEEPAPIAASEVPPPAETPPAGGEATPPAEEETPAPPVTGSESAGTKSDPKPTQREIGAGVNPQGTTQQTLEQATPTPASAPAQSTPSALAGLTSGAALEDTTQDTGQTEGTAGQDKTTDDKKPQATPAILAPFQKQAQIEKTPETQDAWA